WGGTSQVAELNRRHVDMDVYAIEQRPGDAADVALNLQWSTATLARGIVPETAGTGIHRSGEHERSRKRQRHRCATDRDFLIFKRLSQDFQDAAIEFRQLVEKQYALMRQRNLAGPGHCTATNQTGVADGVMRRAKGPLSHQAGTAGQSRH